MTRQGGLMHKIVKFINVNKYIFKRQRNGAHYSGERKALKDLGKSFGFHMVLQFVIFS